ncbi:MAG: 3',5'-cyclic-nucleotide phosphodiesterase pde1 [Trizodia sp. TS-e1964]|nr:MAG: 3',5'-cyclic-nucleotide phosphodiesterase pde1 [Trizodia sp. TS-e1964]
MAASEWKSDAWDRLPAFHVIVLGSGGGPKEDNLPAFLVRSISTNWAPGSILSLDAGSHLAAICHILSADLQTSTPPSGPTPSVATGAFAGLPLPEHIGAEAYTADEIARHIVQNLVSSYLITHPHLDHIHGLILNTPIFTSPPKQIVGLPSTIDGLRKHIYNNVIMPNLSNENGGPGLLTYTRLTEGSVIIPEAENDGYTDVAQGLSTQCWSISHGSCASKGGVSRVYDSSAFFIRDALSNTELLIFGDIEPDSISRLKRNRRVWEEAAARISAGQLAGIFIECSYDDTRPDSLLFGHLAPRHVVEELKVLASLVRRQARGRPLEGLPVVIMHMKDTLEGGAQIGERVARDFRTLEKRAMLGCCFIVSRRGLALSL